MSLLFEKLHDSVLNYLSLRDAFSFALFLESGSQFFRDAGDDLRVDFCVILPFNYG